MWGELAAEQIKNEASAATTREGMDVENTVNGNDVAAGVIDADAEAKKLAESWGLKVFIGDHVFNQNNHFAGTDEERASDFQKALDNPSIKAIWCARGGYGLSRIIDTLDFTAMQSHPKWVIGFSDITVLHAALQKKGIMSIHGPMAAAFSKGPEGEPYI